MTTGLTAIAIIGLLAFVNESMVEWVFGEWLDKRWMKYLALLGGVLLALAFQITILRTLAGLNAPYYADAILSGLVMGRGSQYVHDFYGKYLAKRPGP